MMYTQEYRCYPGCIIANTAGNPMGGNYAIWPVRLRRMLGGRQDVFYCPAQDPRCRWSAEAQTLGTPATAVHERYGYEVGEPMLDDLKGFFSYGYNWGGSNFGGGIADRTQLGLGNIVNKATDPMAIQGYQGELPVTRVRSPSQMIAIGDTVADGWADFEIAPGTDLGPKGKARWPGAVHRNGANVLFCDGHVQWYLQKEMMDLSATTSDTKEMRRMWNNTHARGIPGALD
jgi:prepilin-type processing-associated H-X9-DG protein